MICTPPTDWTGIIGTGQSLAVGAYGVPPISLTQPYHNLKLFDSGPAPKYPLDGNGKLSLVPLVEPMRPMLADYTTDSYPNNIYGETIHAGLATQLTALSLARDDGDYVTIHTDVGWSGHGIVDINKEGTGTAYPGSLMEARAIKKLADAAGKTLAYGAIILTHGETDALDDSYADQVYALWQDYNVDLKALTGQTQDIPLLLTQQSTMPGAQGPSTSVYPACLLATQHPGQIVCVGPRYPYHYETIDGIHLDAPGYVGLGEKYAQVYDLEHRTVCPPTAANAGGRLVAYVLAASLRRASARLSRRSGRARRSASPSLVLVTAFKPFGALVVRQQRQWKPLQPNQVRFTSQLITVTFDVPVPPLQWDDNIQAPHQTINPQWALGRGFEVLDQSGTVPTISGVEIIGDNQVNIQLAAALVPPATLSYAMYLDTGVTTVRRGQLRDSDPFVGADQESIPCQVTSGSAIVSATTGSFVRRTIGDRVSGGGLPADTVIKINGANGTSPITLSNPWSGPSGAVALTFQHNQFNYCIHFMETGPG